MDNELNIGMAFSGGGYRAATYDLGTLSFLNSIRLDDGRTLLDCVTVLSSVSGGTIPALKYMLARSKGQPVGEMIRELFTFLCKEDLVTPAMNSIGAERGNRDSSSIKLMAEVYDEYLFGGATMGDIIEKIDDIPVKDYTALATDFDHSLPFRFRVTSGKTTQNEPLRYGYFGNGKNVIGSNVVPYITLGEAMACSSCFPSGFEPMMFPDDFKVSQVPEIARNIKKRFGIMDGGIVDNQGIDPIVQAEKRMFKYRKDKTRKDKALDLVIISDVSNSEIKDSYAPCEQLLPKCLGRLTLGRLRNYGLIAEAVSAALFAVALLLGSNFWTGVMSVILALVTAANVVGMVFKRKMFEAIRKTFVGDRASFISHLKFASLESLLMNRAKSILMMSSEVFLKRLRQMSYESIYEDEQWHNRVITSTVYELRPGERWQSRSNNGTLPEGLAPSAAIQQISARAANMGTTLWFTEEDKASGVPQDLLAAGQFTACYNLLQYIDDLEQDPTNLTDGHRLIMSCKPQLLAAWYRFQEDPHCMVPEL